MEKIEIVTVDVKIDRHSKLDTSLYLLADALAAKKDGAIPAELARRWVNSRLNNDPNRATEKENLKEGTDEDYEKAFKQEAEGAQLWTDLKNLYKESWSPKPAILAVAAQLQPTTAKKDLEKEFNNTPVVTGGTQETADTTGGTAQDTANATGATSPALTLSQL